MVKNLSGLVKNLGTGTVLTFMVVGMIGSVYGLRTNNLNMLKLRDSVFIADKENGDVEAALQDLRSFVTGHMNTNLEKNTSFSIEGEKPIQLVYKYYRDTVSLYESSLTKQKDLAVLAKAQTVCEKPDVDVSFKPTCLAGEIANNTAIGQSFPNVPKPDKTFYIFDFNSPNWSPDLAGFSLVLFAASITIILFRSATLLVTKITR